MSRLHVWNQNSVCVVTVTYGDRWQYLSRVLRALSEMPSVRSTIVVDNGSLYDVKHRISESGVSRATVISMAENTGSAAGYAAGLRQAAKDTTCAFIWLLDDDNLPAPESLDTLLEQHRELCQTAAINSLAVQALRRDRLQHVHAARGTSRWRCFSWKSSYLGFHVVQTVLRKIANVLVPVPSSDVAQKCVRLPMGMYGGLLFHRSLLDLVGYPDEQFFLYGDDTEFTLRIAQVGSVFLVPGAQIEDLESSWHAVRHRAISPFLRNCVQVPELRLYYSMRNGAYIWREYFASTKLMYRINRWLYLQILRRYLSIQGMPERYSLIHRAIIEGEAGRLGRRPLALNQQRSGEATAAGEHK